MLPQNTAITCMYVPVVLNRVYLFAFFHTFLEQQAGLNTGVGELFLLHHAVQNAERLTAFVSANDDPDIDRR